MASENLLNYIWDTQILPQAGYSFSRLHAVGYSLIALQEMNLAHYYPQVYWNTACLSVNAGADEDNDNNKSTNYGKVASAIGQMQSRGIKVTLPDINKAGFGFTPDKESNSIVFGLKGISGINDDLVHDIIFNRPFESFDNFIAKMFITSKAKKSQMIQLIKAGCFDEFDDRMIVMKQFINHIYEPKQKLTMANLKMLIELDVIPDKYNMCVRYFKYKDYISKLVHKTVAKPKDKLLLLDEISTQFFNENFSEECIVDIFEGSFIISEKKFKKEYDKKMEVIKEWLVNEETLRLVNQVLMENEWNEIAKGSISEWEMSSLSFYYNEHELLHVNKEKYGIVNYFDLPEEPKVSKTFMWRGREMSEYETYRIAGTVLDKDKTKHTVTILTVDGVVILKLYGGSFNHYNRQISQKVGEKKEVLEKTWFTRGNRILVSGFRRGNQFIPKVYKNSIYNHTLALINNVDNEGNITLTTERVNV